MLKMNKQGTLTGSKNLFSISRRFIVIIMIDISENNTMYNEISYKMCNYIKKKYYMKCYTVYIILTVLSNNSIINLKFKLMKNGGFSYGI